MSTSDQMDAYVLQAFGEPLRKARLNRPDFQAHEVLVRVAASGVNPLDTKIRAGAAGHAQTQLPAVLGIDLAGTVEAVGSEVTGFAPGDRVYGMTGGIGDVQGSLAQYAAVDAELIAKSPAQWTARQAAAVPLAAITAWEGLVDRCGVGPGHKVLIQGGAGGVGHLATQLAVYRGAEVYATGSAAELDAITKFGATAIDYRAVSPAEYVETHTGGEGFDIIFDTVGGATLDVSFGAVRRYTGHVASILGWGSHSLAPLSFRGATYSGVFTLLPLLTGLGRRHHGEILREITAIAEAGGLTPSLDPRLFTLDTVHEAHAEVENGTARGKIVITVEPS